MGNRDCALSHQQFPVLSEEGYEYPLLGVAAGPTLPSSAITGSHKPETRQEKKQKEKKQKEKKQTQETKRDCVLSRQRSPVLSEEGYEFPLLGAAACPTLPSFAITGSRKPETRQEKKIKEKKQKEKKQKEKKQKEKKQTQETKRDCVLSRQRSPVLS